MIKVKNIKQDYFDILLDSNITAYERKFILDARRSQVTYAKLTKNKYIYFWLIFNKYFDITMEIQREIQKEFGELKETSDAFKERKQQAYNSRKCERAKLEEQEREYWKKKGNKYFS